jgi:hypothetical protein
MMLAEKYLSLPVFGNQLNPRARRVRPMELRPHRAACRQSFQHLSRCDRLDVQFQNSSRQADQMEILRPQGTDPGCCGASVHRLAAEPRRPTLRQVRLKPVAKKKSTQMLRERLWLLLPVFALYIADVSFTLAGQPAAYWTGDHAAAVEGNPLTRPLLVQSPTWFLLVAAVWLVAMVAVILWWPRRAGGLIVAWLVAIVHATAHAVGGASWLIHSADWSLLVAGLYLAAAAELSWWCWRRAAGGLDDMSTGPPRGDDHEPHL